MEDDRARSRSGSRTASCRSAAGRSAPKKNGMATPSPASSCARPIVTTIRISRGALEKRRMMTHSIDEPEHDRDDQRERHRDPERPAPQRDERHAEARGHRAEVGLGEVDDPVRPVDEREPERHQRGERADDEAPHHDAERRRPDELERDVEGGDARAPTGQQPDLAEVRHAPLMPGEASHMYRERPMMTTQKPQ